MKKRKKTKVQVVNAAMRKAGGKSPRQKGDRFERECVNFLCANGLFAERVPLSGAAGGSFDSDVQVSLYKPGRGEHDIHKFECKIRQRAWLDLYQWLEGNFGLFIRRDKGEALVVLRLKDFAELHGETW